MFIVKETIEESVGGSIGVTEAAHIPKQRGEQLLDSAVRYAEQRHWDVVPGTWLEAVEGAERCSCGAEACVAPGAHPSRPDWSTQATGSAVAARRLWGKQPKASILLPTGRTFDALDVSESAGFLALARMERMDLALGPVTCTPDRRMIFFVLPGAALKVPDLVRKLGWTPSSIDLVARGDGHYVAAPPTRVGSHGAVQWVRRPTPANRWLPDAEELISPLAYACGREAADERDRRS
ncbi:bifunctional DNA primase/polymerase [Streptomyces sp. NPDC054841]